MCFMAAQATLVCGFRVVQLRILRLLDRWFRSVSPYLNTVYDSMLENLSRFSTFKVRLAFKTVKICFAVSTDFDGLFACQRVGFI